MTDALGRKTSYAYDSCGNVTGVTPSRPATASPPRRASWPSESRPTANPMRVGEARIKDYQERLTMKYAAMEAAVGRLKAMGQSLGISF